MSATETKAAEGTTIDTLEVRRIMEMIPHRYPMLLVDRVINLRLGEGAIGIKNVSINEPFFQGHFPTEPVMPGVLIVESMAQTAGVVVVATMGADAEGKLVYFMSIDGARFRRPVVPGDRVEVHVQKLQSRQNVWKFSGKAIVDGNIAAEATFAAMIRGR
ncbi:3-hydroxyacyl-ACP dehydratase FabZ [Vineibacter terrae]|uniref:3-hydroxyacyl-ACP dehydratase FabZ n=1 Tax=Vineibacter terrae TaxID=2586908 RepID=UPI002E37FC22|nr:3-hydroxyacyl-ACP dehydratase FabZ [Vineibacter terrae]HEX2885847.1 3-hydroxyacyl-ACP dehydratase FabZ [Vineibacter terrae]